MKLKVPNCVSGVEDRPDSCASPASRAALVVIVMRMKENLLLVERELVLRVPRCEALLSRCALRVLNLS